MHNLLVSDIANYLHRTTWKPTKPYKKGVQVFQGPLDLNGEPLEIVLPTDEQSHDREMYIRSALNLLSALSMQTPEVIAQHIRGYERDILHISNINIGSQGAIGLTLAAMQVLSIKQILAYAACSERQPRPSFPGISKNSAKIVEGFQFAHTVHGSFGFVIESPVGDQQELPLFSETEPIDIQKYIIPPIERRIMERLVRGLLSLQQALLRHDPSFISRAYAAGFNANMCRAMLKMSDHYRVPIEYKISWSPKIPPSDDIAHVEPIVLEGEAYSYLSQALTDLKNIPPQETTIIGHIIGLISRDNPMASDETPRLVMIRGINRNDRTTISIGVVLSIEDYRLALDAHLHWQQVEISGELTRVGNTWQLSFYHDFNVLSSSNRAETIPLIKDLS
jgi:hypothetical protein